MITSPRTLSRYTNRPCGYEVDSPAVYIAKQIVESHQSLARNELTIERLVAQELEASNITYAQLLTNCRIASKSHKPLRSRINKIKLICIKELYKNKERPLRKPDIEAIVIDFYERKLKDEWVTNYYLTTEQSQEAALVRMRYKTVPQWMVDFFNEQFYLKKIEKQSERVNFVTLILVTSIFRIKCEEFILISSRYIDEQNKKEAQLDALCSEFEIDKMSAKDIIEKYQKSKKVRYFPLLQN